jgi:uncharacterized caspase-like protein
MGATASAGACVVGNAAYRHAERLANPVNDAKGVRDALQKLNFDVVYGEDLDLKALSRAIGQFADKVADADVALVFFAGHGATFGETPYIVLDLISQSFDEAHSPSHRATANTFAGQFTAPMSV